MLIACDECGAMISDRAVSCPQCGIPKVKAAVVNGAVIAAAGSKEQIATAPRPKSSKNAMMGLLLVAALGLGAWLVFRAVEPASTQSPDTQRSPAELAEKLKAECRSGQPAACFTLAQQACDADNLELCVALAMKVEQEAYLKLPESDRSIVETQSPLFKSLLALYGNVCERGAMLGCYRKIKFAERWPTVGMNADEIRAKDEGYDESRSKQCDAGIEPACEWSVSHAQPSNAATVLEKMCLTHPTPYFRAHACLEAATTIKNDYPRNRKRLDPRVPQLWAKSCLGFEAFQSDSGLAIEFDEYGDLVNRSTELFELEGTSRAKWASIVCDGAGSEKSTESLAEPYFTIACNQGRDSKCMGLAKIYLSKTELYKPALAFAALQKACLAGALYHCQEAATLAIEGKLIAKDEAAAQTLLETACNDSAKLCFALGNFFLNHSQLENHREIAMLKYRRACDDSDYGYSADAISACLAVADLLLENQTEGDAKAAFDVLVKGCQHAQKDDYPFQSYEPANIGCERAVRLLAEGTRIPRDIVAAAQLKSTFCDKQQTAFMAHFGSNGYFSARVAKFCRTH